MNKVSQVVGVFAFIISLLFNGSSALALTNPTTTPATNPTTSDALLNAMNGDDDATGHSFWASLNSFSTASPTLTPGVTFSTPDLGPVSSSTSFSASLSSTGIAVTPNTMYFFAPWSLVGGTWFPGSVFSFMTNPLPVPGVTTVTASAITANDATLNGINGQVAADNESFWVSTSTFSVATPSIPAGVYSTPVFGALPASGTFSTQLSTLSTSGIPSNIGPIGAATTYYFVAWANIGGIWYHGAVQSFTTAKLAQTITFNSIADATYGDAPVTLSASSNSNNPIVYTSATPSICSAGTSTVTILSVGSCTINAGQASSTFYYDAPTVSQSFNITPKTITLSGVSITPKIYDATTTATLAGVTPILVGLLPSDVSQVSANFSGATYSYADVNVGTNKPVTIIGITLNGLPANNYTLTQPTATSTITARPITITAASSTRTYNATTTSNAIPTITVGSLQGTDTAILFERYNTKNVGTGKTLTPVALITDGTNGNNYSVTYINNTTGVITPRTLQVTPVVANKVYDATTLEPVTFTDNRRAGDILTISGTATFANKLVGTGKVVSLTTVNATGTDAGNYTLSVSNSPLLIASITPSPLVSTLISSNKVYDGTTTASSSCTVVPLLSDVVSCVAGASAFDTKNVGVGKIVTASGITITGADALNYSVTASATTTANITKAPVTALFTASDKIYDATTVASITTSSVAGVIAPDSVTISGGTAAFADKNVGTGKPVTATGFTLGGSDGGNYMITSVGTTTANITARPLAVTATGVNKVYDGTTTATVIFSDNRIAGDVFNPTNGTATFSPNKNVGNSKTINVTGINVTGPDAGNYTANTTTSTSANITVKPITVRALANTKVYNGTTNSLTLPALTTAALAPGDTATTFSEIYDTKDVGTGKTLTPVIVISDGNSGNNYVVTLINSTAGVITTAPVTIAFTIANKIYDGNASSTILTSTVLGAIAPDVVTASGGTAVFDTKNASTSKLVTASGFTLNNSNYSVATVTPTTANITPRTLAATASGVDKIYDASITASVIFIDNRITGDILVATGSARFATKTAGIGKIVLVSGITIDGTDAMNYFANATTSSMATITTRPITVSATALSKVFDGLTAAITTLTNNALSGDVVTQSATSSNFDTSVVGTTKLVTVSGITLGGTDSTNYALSTSTATTSADITAAPVVSSGGGGGGNGPISGSSFSSGSTGGSVLGASTSTVSSETTPTTNSTTTQSNTNTSRTGSTILFKFLKNMRLGSKVSPDVTELQKILIAQGYLNMAVPNGVFNKATRTAVIKYQKAHGIIGSGNVLLLTRTALNAGI